MLELTREGVALLAWLRELPDGLHIPPDFCPSTEEECSYLLRDASSWGVAVSEAVETATSCLLWQAKARTRCDSRGGCGNGSTLLTAA